MGIAATASLSRNDRTFWKSIVLGSPLSTWTEVCRASLERKLLAHCIRSG